MRNSLCARGALLYGTAECNQTSIHHFNTGHVTANSNANEMQAGYKVRSNGDR